MRVSGARMAAATISENLSLITSRVTETYQVFERSIPRVGVLANEKKIFSSGCGELKGCEPSQVRKYIMIDPTSSHSLSFLYFLTIYG